MLFPDYFLKNETKQHLPQTNKQNQTNNPPKTTPNTKIPKTQKQILNNFHNKILEIQKSQILLL